MLQPAVPYRGTTATGAPLRTAFLYFPNGAIPGWWPKGAGKDFALNRTMEPLANVKDNIQILAGLADVSANPCRWRRRPRPRQRHLPHRRAHQENQRRRFSRRHFRRSNHGAANWAAHALSFARTFLRRRAERRRVRHRLRLRLSAQPGLEHAHHAAHAGGESPPACSSGCSAPARPRNARRTCRSARSRNVRCSTSSKRAELRVTRKCRSATATRLDEYFTGVRDIELRIQAAEQSRAGAATARADAPGGIPASYPDYVRLMYDMLHPRVPDRLHARRHLHDRRRRQQPRLLRNRRQ